MSCFYLSDGPDRFLSQSATAGPWGPGSQHGGPPAALLTRAVERLVEGRDLLLGRLTVDLLGPVPVGTGGQEPIFQAFTDAQLVGHRN